ncbi:MAG: hypothetical protein KIT31_35070 [Deltaproteobacteria bacterium]|nr:hypothetical protein [Deltaproteobacteria bacterium]
MGPLFVERQRPDACAVLDANARGCLASTTPVVLKHVLAGDLLCGTIVVLPAAELRATGVVGRARRG